MPARAEESSSSCAQNQRVRITPMFDHQLSITPTAIHPPGPSNAQFQTRFKAEDRLLCNFSGATWQPTANMEKGPSKRFWYTFYQFLRNLTGIFPRYPGEKRTGGCKVVNLCFKSLPASPVRGAWRMEYRPAVERMWRIKDSQGQIPALSCRQKSSKPFKVFPLRLAADRTNS